VVRKTADEAEKTRARIVDAALFVFAERGVQAAQLEEIARRAGVTRGALYHHFSGKSELLSAVLKERWQTAMEPVLEPLRANQGAPAVRAFVERFLEIVDSSATVRALLTLSLSGELGSLEASGIADKAKAFDEWLELLDHNIAAGKRSRRDLRLRSEGVLHYLLGYSVWSSLMGPPQVKRHAARAAQVLEGLFERELR
jgi:TetR/AcrR family acrAB operon transcriptional repressor